MRECDDPSHKSTPRTQIHVDLPGGFFALVPTNPIPTLLGFASHIVEEFERFRDPLSQGEFQRHLRSPIDETETTHLVRWGYPCVFDRFRLHMTLTDRVSARKLARLAERVGCGLRPVALRRLHHRCSFPRCSVLARICRAVPVYLGEPPRLKEAA
ncbi:DUF1045 domain-containing protein [Bradyrhizobium iriomotense]|uniref:DUF1045 domain-containing protein n=1 Tax=Bradyrhizobium iriomotense TaxID=441950 RepID=UPI003D66BE46